MKTKLTLIIFSLLLLQNTITNAQPGSWQWAKSSTNDGNDDVVNSIATDNNGNVYAVGSFTGSTITFGTFTLTNINPAGLYYDIFIVKYDSTGTVQWAINAGSNSAESARGVAVDAAGNVYVTGSYNGTYCAFGSTIVNNGVSGGNMFLAKYTTSGILLWATNNSAITGGISGTSVATDAVGNAYITGSFTCSSFGIGLTALNNSGAAGTNDIFIAKYDTGGNPLWAHSAGGASGNDYGNCISIDANGNAYVTGSFYGGATFGSTTLFTLGLDGMYLAKYDSLGNIKWAKDAYGYPGRQSGQGVSVSTNNAIYVTGKFNTDSILFGTQQLYNAGDTSSTYDAFLVKYDSTGTAQWAHSAGGTRDEWGFSVSSDNSGNVYAAGMFGSTTIFPAGFTLTNAGIATFDIFIVKYDASGNLLWTTSVGGARDAYVFSISTFGSDNLYVGGSYYSSSITFGTTTLTNANTSTTTTPYADSYVAKLGSLLTVNTSTLNDASNEIDVFPNPTSSCFTITSTNKIETIKVYNILGDVIRNYELGNKNGSNVSINIDDVSKGIYFVEIKTEREVVRKKIIKE